MFITVQHMLQNRKTGEVEGYRNVAVVSVPEEVSAFGTTLDCLEYAYRWTNNVQGSWSIKKTSFPDPANGDRVNGDYNENVAVLYNRPDGMGQRSTMMGDRMEVDGKTYKVASFGFTELELETV